MAAKIVRPSSLRWEPSLIIKSCIDSRALSSWEIVRNDLLGDFRRKNDSGKIQGAGNVPGIDGID